MASNSPAHKTTPTSKLDHFSFLWHRVEPPTTVLSDSDDGCRTPSATRGVVGPRQTLGGGDISNLQCLGEVDVQDRIGLEVDYDLEEVTNRTVAGSIESSPQNPCLQALEIWFVLLVVAAEWRCR